VNPALVGYVTLVAAAGGVVLGFSFHSLHAIGWMQVCVWILVSLLAESLWLSTITGKAMESMASTVDLSLLVLLGFRPAVWIVAIAFALANIFFSRRAWYKAVFNAGQNVLSLTAAGLAFELLGGHPLVGGGLKSLHGAALIVPWTAATVVYFLTNTLFVSGAVALSSGRDLHSTWRQEYLYANSLLGSAALFFLSPLIVVSYLAVGFFGLIFFFVPLLLIKEAGARYIALEKAKDEMVHSERLAAKGEMAAEIAHELNNYLAAISGRAQLLLMGVGKQPVAKIEENTRIIAEQARNMGVLVKGLLDFSHKEIRRQPTQLNDLLRKTVEFISPQNKYERVAFDLDLAPDLPETNLDPGQIQQVLMNLFSNSADAIGEAGAANRDPRIAVRTRVRGEEVAVTVEDNGPGIDEKVIHRVFEPSVTTKPTGHGFGLSTCYRIVKNHGGSITAENGSRGGARFTIILPLERKKLAA
jgi:signal transduction histidine kinase